MCAAALRRNILVCSSGGEPTQRTLVLTGRCWPGEAISFAWSADQTHCVDALTGETLLSIFVLGGDVDTTDVDRALLVAADAALNKLRRAVCPSYRQVLFRRTSRIGNGQSSSATSSTAWSSPSGCLFRTLSQARFFYRLVDRNLCPMVGATFFPLGGLSEAP
jgi:hypothetical protein